MCIRRRPELLLPVVISLAGHQVSGQVICDNQELLAAGGQETGISVDLDGSRAIVGASLSDLEGVDSGSAHVFADDGGTWSAQATLVASDAAAMDWFGHAVAISGDVAIVGASRDDDNGADSGSAYIFRFDGSVWVEQAKLLPLPASIGDRFGAAVAIDGDVAIVGAFARQQSAGAAYIFRFNGTAWTQEAALDAATPANGDAFGTSVAIAGDVAMVGVPNNDTGAANAGSVDVYGFGGSTWSLSTTLTAPVALSGAHYGFSVSMHGDVAIVGAPDAVGRAYVRRNDGIAWHHEATLTASDGVASDDFGFAVAIDGDVAMVGSPFWEGPFTNQGTAYRFVREGLAWTEQAHFVAPDGSNSANAGAAVALSGEMAIVGSPNGNGLVAGQGTAYVVGPRVPATDCNGNGIPDEECITLKIDCNANLVPDSCDIEDGTSADCNANGVPDECIAKEDDCNANLVPDACDIAGGTSVDCNANGVPDECAGEGDDCNANDQLDSCDIVARLSQDSNGNIVPDECEGPVLCSAQQINGDPFSSFGHSIGLHGDLMITGIPNPGIEEARVFRHDGRSWVQEAILHAPVINGNFGISVDVEGTIAVVGANLDDTMALSAGAVHVFRFDGAQWSLETTLYASDPVVTAQLGQSVSVEGDLIVAGAQGSFNPGGAAYVFRHNGTSWVEEAKLVPVQSEAEDRFGAFISLSGERVLVSAYARDAVTGAAFVFRHVSKEEWVQEAMLSLREGVPGNRFGIGVSLDGDRALVGVDKAIFAVPGEAYVYERTGSQWIEQARLVAWDGGDDNFGTAVALSGPRLVIAAPGADDYRGGAYSFKLQDGSWERGAKLADPIPAPPVLFAFGTGVALQGTTAAVTNPDLLAQAFVATYDVTLVTDADANGVADQCESCLTDLDGDGLTGITDLLSLLAAWGPAGSDGFGDLDGDGVVGITDLLSLLAGWGPC